MRTSRCFAILLIAASLGACMRSIDPVNLTDAGIKARIELELRGRPDLDIRYVTVDVDSGVVTFSGVVNTYREKEAIYRIASRTRGVEQVLVNLVVPE